MGRGRNQPCSLEASDQGAIPEEGGEGIQPLTAETCDQGELLVLGIQPPSVKASDQRVLGGVQPSGVETSDPGGGRKGRLRVSSV